MNRRFALIIVFVTVILSSFRVQSQDYKFEMGGGIGASGYLGDVNKSNFLKHPGFAAGGMFRYIIDYRWALKASLYTAGLSGNSADFQEVFPGGETYKFNSQIYDLGAQIEFNFFNFGIGYTYKNLHRLTPYITVGLGSTLSSCGGNTSFALNIPVGAGVKYKLKERLNLGFEFTMRKVFGDKVDNFTVDDLNGIKSSFMKNTDWYSLMMFSITYEFGKKCKVCHYVE